MNYAFDLELAKGFGVEESIMIQNFQFWIAKNKSVGAHLHDGRTWTYNSAQAFAMLFPFWTAKQIRRILDSLIQQKVLIIGNYNSRSYNRSIWYAFENEARFITVGIPAGSQDEYDQAMAAAEIARQEESEGNQPIQESEPKPRPKPITPPATTKHKTPRNYNYLDLSENEMEIVKMIFNEWNNCPDLIHHRLPPTPKQVKIILEKCKEYLQTEIIQSIKNYSEIISNSGDGKKYYFNYRWTLEDFMQRGLHKFFDTSYPLSNYLNKSFKNNSRAQFTEESDFDEDILKYGTEEQKQMVRERKTGKELIHG